MADNEGQVIYYFGADEAYFKTLQGDFSRHSKIKFKLKRIYEDKESNIQSLFLKIFKDKPAVVFIDFSKQTQDYLHLARLVSRTPLEHPLVTIGLVDYLSSPETLAEAMGTGLHLTHIKSSESFDVVFDVMKLISPNEMGEHGFATASLKEEMEVGVPAKVGFISPEGIHFETNLQLTVGSKVKIKHFWGQNKIVPSREFMVKNVSQANLFYHYGHSCDADFVFIDEIMDTGQDAERSAERKAERLESIKVHKKQLKKWIEDNLTRSQEKKAKVLIVDKEFHFFQQQARTDKYPYIIRCLPYLIDVSEELENLRPQFIAFALDKEDNTDPKNNMEKLARLAEILNVKYSNINAFIIVFNSKLDSKELQSSLKFANCMAISSEPSVELLLKMANLYEKKMSSTPSFDKSENNTVYLKKSNASSNCEILISITVVKLSETDMIFHTDRELPIGTILHFNTPVDMYVNVQPTKGPSKGPEYHGIIHCIGEVPKKELRRYVNTIFFRDHDAQVQTEVEEFKKLNKTKEQQKKGEEEAALKAKEQEAAAVANEEKKTS